MEELGSPGLLLEVGVTILSNERLEKVTGIVIWIINEMTWIDTDWCLASGGRCNCTASAERPCGTARCRRCANRKGTRPDHSRPGSGSSSARGSSRARPGRSRYYGWQCGGCNRLHLIMIAQN